MAKIKYYSLEPILELNAPYNLIIGEKSNGKTFAVFDYALKQYCRGQGSLALVRRYDKAILGANASQMFASLVCDGNGKNRVAMHSDGKWDSIVNKGPRWYLAKYDEEKDKYIKDTEPFCYGFAINNFSTTKGPSYPHTNTIMLDEMIAEVGESYLPDEFNRFMKIVSTIARLRDNVKVFMCGNSISPWSCPYFKGFGLNNIRKMQPGTIDLYTSKKDERLTYAVEMTKPNKEGRPNDYLFAFDSPDLEMITHGGWQTNAYPLCPMHYEPKDVKFRYFIILEDYKFEAEIVQRDGNVFTFIHPKTHTIQDESRQLIYSQEYSPLPNYRRKITVPTSTVEKKILDFFKKEKVFYSDNETGEAINAYLKWCATDKVVK